MFWRLVKPFWGTQQIAKQKKRLGFGSPARSKDEAISSSLRALESTYVTHDWAIIAFK